MIDEIWLPAALRFGISIKEFWELNPKYMYLYQEDYIRGKEGQIKTLDIAAYYQGMYVQQAIASCLSKKMKYPKKPLSLKQSEQKRMESMTEEEYYEAMKDAISSVNRRFS